MLGWSAQTTVIAMVLAAIAILASRSRRLGPAARHVLWLVVMIKLVAPPVVNWPWSPPGLWSTPKSSPTPSPAAIADPVVNWQDATALDEPSRVPREGGGPAEGRPSGTPHPMELRPAWARPVRPLGGHFGDDRGVANRPDRAVSAPTGLGDSRARVVGARGSRSVRSTWRPRAEILVVPDLAPPMLWFLGRTKLLVPGRLVNADAFGADLLGLRAILAHELAHLRRGDHWVRRLDFFAGLIWWWNPVYWLTRERLCTEAELACDEWAIRTVPDGRVSYAEALLDVCRTLSTTGSPAPALGVTGAGRFLERRVKMILQNHAPSRISVPVLLGAGLLLLLALPGWSAAGSRPTNPTNSPQAKSSDSGPSKSARPTSKEDKNLVANRDRRGRQSHRKADDDDDDKAARTTRPG